MGKEKFKHLFRRYADREASEEERKVLFAMADSGEYDEMIRQYISMFLTDSELHDLGSGSDMHDEQAAKILRGILDRETTHHATQKIFQLKDQRGKQSYFSSWRWVAAIVLILAGVSWFSTILISESSETTVVQSSFIQEVVTQKGERTNLILTDGSRVILNADSKLQISSGFGSLNRELKLQGEAYFEVEKNLNLPFMVYTHDNLYTEVLSTQFNVRSYEANRIRDNGMIGVDVVVAEGRVRFGSLDENQPNTVTISSGQRGEIGRDGIISVSVVPDLNKYHGWINGQLIFEDHSFDKVVSELERWFDLDITVTDPALYERRFSASFQNDPLSEVLQIISQSLQIDFEHEQREVRFSPKTSQG